MSILPYKTDATYLRWAAKNLLRISFLGVDPGPVRILQLLKRYPWVSAFLKVNKLMGRLMGNRRGVYREVTGYILNRFVDVFADITRDLDRYADRIVWHEDLVPPEVIYAMGLNPFMVEMLGIVLPLVDVAQGERLIDEAENAGLPADTCTLPRISVGLGLKKHLPPPLCVVTSNSPCDGGMTSYAFLEELYHAPTFRLDMPYRYKDPEGIAYYVKEMKKMIAFLEEHTPGRMDWDRLRAVCEERNRATAYELELWELLRHKPAPLGSDVVFLGHLAFALLQPGRPRSTQVFKQLLEFAKESMRSGGGLPDEKYRVLLWNPPTLIFPELFSWSEQEYRTTMVMDMLTFNRHPIIDTSTPDTMLHDLAQIFMQGPMAQHTRGPVEYFFEDLFFIHEHYSTDTIWMAGHIGCKNTQALLGMMREKCRRRDIPLLIIEYDLGDSRVVSADGIKEQVTMFMKTVMGA